MKNLGLYIHIPFCYSKCNYCDFNSKVCDEKFKKIYVKALINEIESTKCNDFVDSVFIGGGTPTALEITDLCSIVEAVYKNFNIKKPEFTIEVNPKTANYNDFLLLKNAGVNRISFGVQSANDDELKILGRIHTFKEFIKTYDECKKAGFKNINTDIMFSLPDQTIDKLRNTIENIVKLNPEHISFYSLILEENTPFYNMKLNLPDENDERAMYDYTCDYLKTKGYIQYEISNFAKENYECIHNIGYWQRADYLGFGAGASSLYKNKRYKNTYDIFDYVKENNREEEILTKNDILEETVFLGLRMNQGINIKSINQNFNIDFYKLHKEKIDKYISLKLAVFENDNLRLTRDGFYVSNEIMSSLI